MVTDDDPLEAVVTVVSRNLRNSAILTSELVLNLVGLPIFGVDGANQ